MKYGKFIEVIGPRVNDYISVAKAVSLDQTRYFMNYCYCEGGKLISTDGRMMFILELGNNPFWFEEKKFYKYLKSTKKYIWFVEIISEVGQFPNYKNVLPTGDPIDTFNFILHNNNRRVYSIQMSNLFKKIPENESINMLHIHNLPKEITFKVSLFGEHKAIQFKSENGLTALSMPFWD
jgi:hypothetical protein